MEVIENMIRYVKKKKNLKIEKWVIFQLYTNFSCPYLKISPVRLDLCLIGVHDIY